MIRLTPSLCIPDCQYSATYVPTCISTHPTKCLQYTHVPSVVYQDRSNFPVFSNEIPCYDLDPSVKCNCTFDQQNDEKFDAYIR